MHTRGTPVIVGLITVAMLAFGQCCALGTLLAPADPQATILSADRPAGATDHESTCDGGCGGDRQEGEHACPSGASMCCATWGPPTARLTFVPPTSIQLGMSDAWLVLPQIHATDARAAEVALFELARPPGPPRQALLASILSRRGPPALT